MTVQKLVGTAVLVLVALFGIQSRLCRADDIEVLENAVRSFQTSDFRTLKIYENSSNRLGATASNERWRFYVQPVLAPERDHDSGALIIGASDYADMPLPNDGKIIEMPSVTLFARIWLIRQADKDNAISELKNVFPNAQIQAGMVDLLPMNQVDFAVPPRDSRFEEQFPGAKFLSKVVPTSGQQHSIVVRWQIPLPRVTGQTQQQRTNALIKRFADWLETSDMAATPHYNVHTKATSVASVKASDLLSTQTVNKLKGNGDAFQVARYEMDKFSEQITSEFKIEYYNNSAAPIDIQQFTKILESRSELKSVDEAGFRQLAQEHLFNARDVSPDTITHYLQQEFSRDQTTHQWKRTGSGSTSASANFLDIIGGSGSFSASFDDEGLETALHEHGLNVDISGDLIVCKTVDIDFFKASDLGRNGGVVMIETTVSKAPEALPGVSFNLFERDANDPAAHISDATLYIPQRFINRGN